MRLSLRSVLIFVLLASFLFFLATTKLIVFGFICSLLIAILAPIGLLAIALYRKDHWRAFAIGASLPAAILFFCSIPAIDDFSSNPAQIFSMDYTQARHFSVPHSMSDASAMLARTWFFTLLAVAGGILVAIIFSIHRPVMPQETERKDKS